MSDTEKVLRDSPRTGKIRRLSRHDVHGWFGSPLFTSPKASGVLIALQKLFFWSALAFLQPLQSAKYHSNSSIALLKPN